MSFPVALVSAEYVVGTALTFTVFRASISASILCNSKFLTGCENKFLDCSDW